MAVISLVALVLCLIPAGYWFLLALGSVRQARRLTWQDRRPEHRFLIAIPAHDEERVIARTVQRLRELDYPSDLYAIHIVADHCSDATAALARQAGAVVHRLGGLPNLLDQVLKLLGRTLRAVHGEALFHAV